MVPERTPCPPAAKRKTEVKTKTIRKGPYDSKGYTHTRLPEGRREAKVRANVHVCAHKRQESEDMTRGRDGTKVRVVEMKGEPSAQGQPMKLTSL